MTKELKPAFKDEAQLLGWGDSDRSGAWLKLRVLPEDLENFRGKQGTVYAVVMVEIDAMSGKPETKKSTKQSPNGTQTVTKQSEKTSSGKPKGPYGDFAASLHKSGFFIDPKVWGALGGDKSYQKWCHTQPCVVTDDFDYVEITPGGGLEPRCDYAHVNTAANSGKGFKAEYSGLPMKHVVHLLSHNTGETAIYKEYVMRAVGALPEGDIEIATREWLEKLVGRHLQAWAHSSICKKAGVKSLTDVDPIKLYNWAVKAKIANHLPKMFKKHKETHEVT